MIRQLFLILCVFATLGFASLAWFGVGSGTPTTCVSYAAQTFVEPTGNFLVFPDLQRPDVFDGIACVKWYPETMPEIAIRTGGGKLGFRRLRLGPNWNNPRGWLPQKKWHFEQFGCLAFIERDSDCLMYPSYSYINCADMDMVVLPWWLPVMIFTWYPSIALVLSPLRRHHRRRRGLCVKCGYNLTGNTTGTCPECGMKFER